MRLLTPLAAALILGVTLAAPAHAAWPISPTVNVPVCTAGGGQSCPSIASDGAGGALLAWTDQRSGFSVYAHHILANGALDPAWPVNGRLVSAPDTMVAQAYLVADGAGGAFVAWAMTQLAVQHVLANGTVDPAWPAGGRILATGSSQPAAGGSFRANSMLARDGAGGVLVAWSDFSTGSWALYLQHVLASGAVDPAWPSHGRMLAALPGLAELQMVADAQGNATVAWNDGTAARAQHVLASGAVDPGWPVGGKSLGPAQNYAQYGGTSGYFPPAIASDGGSGAYIAWHSDQVTVSVQHVVPNGPLDPSWPAAGVAYAWRPLSGSGFSVHGPIVMIPDGNGGAIYTFEGDSFEHTRFVGPNGGLSFGSGGLGRATIPYTQSSFGGFEQPWPALASDGVGGAIAAYSTGPSTGTSSDLYAARIDAPGTGFPPGWPSTGAALCTATGYQDYPAAVSDGQGGAIFVWSDQRSGSWDLYAQRVNGSGQLGSPEPYVASVTDVPADQGGHVTATWTPGTADTPTNALVATYDVMRADARVVPLAWSLVGSVPATHAASYTYDVPTYADSTVAGWPLVAVQIVAHGTDGTTTWSSWPGSGGSIDNLPPAVPAAFTADWSAGTAHLHWNRNTESDLANYRLYRDTLYDYVPSPAKLVAAPPDSGWADATTLPVTYRLSAVDVHGNESGTVRVRIESGGNVGIGDALLPRELALAAPSPNPASRATTLRYALPAAGRATLRVYDAAGRLVRTLEDGARPAGEHALEWNLLDANGRLARSGLYFARLDVEGRTFVRRIAVVN